MTVPDPPLLAGLELGGTKTLAVLARGTQIIDRYRIPTDSPDIVLPAIEAWFAETAARHGAPVALGIASFGPLALDPCAPDHGCLTATPKPGWAGASLLHRFADRLDVPVRLDTDVNGAALAEQRWGAAQGATVVVYVTIGTGVGAGVVIDGRPVHGHAHPEFGHIRLRRVTGDDFAGVCPWHGDCLEGLVSGPALAARTGMAGTAITADHPVWNAVAADLGEAMAILILTIAPGCIIIGGGVGMGQLQLLPRIAAATAERLAGYCPEAVARLADGLIRAPALGEDAGPMGAIALAMDALAMDALA